MTQQEYKYFAFISYNSKDTEWGRRVQRKLEGYRMPATLCNERGWKRQPIKPVFFAPTDIQPGGLTEELQERLKASRNLIVICSPNSAQSEWVGKEIAFFHSLGRTKQIHFFIIEGQPHSNNPLTECFNPVVGTLGLPEILGANIHERTQTFPFTNISWPWMDKQRAYVQLVSKLLGVEFDAIWQRHRRQLIQKAIGWVIAVVMVLAVVLGVYISSQPVDVDVRLNEASIHNDNLPPLKDAVVTLTLDNEKKTDTIYTLDASTAFTNIPHRFLGKEVRVQVVCRDFLSVDTIVVLDKQLSLDIRRDEQVYGDIHFKLWNEESGQPLPHTAITVAGFSAVSDSEGMVRLFIPLARQDTLYPLHAAIHLADTLLAVPHTEDAAILVKGDNLLE